MSDLSGLGDDDLVRDILDASGRDVRLFRVSQEVLASFVRVVNEQGGGTDVRVLADRRVLKRAMDDFLVASGTSGLVERGVLELRSADDGTDRSLAVLEDAVVGFVSFGDRVGALESTDTGMLEAASDAFEDQWSDAEPFDIRTPPISTVMASLRDEIGPETANDFAAILDELDEARGDGDGLDEIAVALLAAARNEVLLYDISKWGEDNGVASKATFSRKKTAMEDAGLIDTENVPIDIGRPRLRLTFADDELHDAPIADLVDRATDALG